MKTYRCHQIVIIVLFSMATNLIGRLTADFYNLPMWLDSFGTFLTAYTLGPICGLMVGISSKVIAGFFNHTSYIYSITASCTALIAGYLAKRGWMESLLKTVSLSVILTFVNVVISGTLVYFVFYGEINNMWGQGISDLLDSLRMPSILCIFVGQFYVNFADKMITLVSVFIFIRFYRTIRPNIPNIFRLSSTLPSLPPLLLFFGTLLIFAHTPLNAQHQHDYNSYVHMIYNKENGIPSGKTNDIVSTTDGILWIGTYEGLYRHNGREFRHMSEFNSISTARCLYVDDEGRLFVGTNDSGLSIVINETVVNTLEKKDGLPDDSIRSITRGSDGLFYVGTPGDLAVLSLMDGLSIYKIIPQVYGAKRLTADLQEHIAAITYSGSLFILHGTDVKTDLKTFPGLKDEQFTAAAFSPDGHLYASTEKNTVLIFSIKENSQATAEGEVKNSTDIKLEQALPCPAMHHINSINFYDDVTFLCADNGAGYLDKDGYHNIETAAFCNSIDNMTQDYQGNLWFASSRMGLLKLSETSFSEIYSSAGLKEEVVNSVTRFNGDLYFATDTGLTAIEGTTGHSLENQLTKSLVNTRIRCLKVSSTGDLWICTKTKGIIQVKKNGKRISYGIGHPFRTSLELSDGIIAAGCDDGVAFITPEQNGIPGKINYWLTASDGFDNPLILTLGQIDETVLAGTDGGGLALIRKDSDERYKIQRLLTKADRLSSNIILRTVNDCQYEEPTGNFYVLTSNAICYLEKQPDSELEYKIRILSNFPYTNNYDLIIRPNNNIFVLSSAGIFIVNRTELLSGSKVEYELLDLKKGLRGSLTANSWNYLDDDGNLYISSDSGSSRLNLSTYDNNDHSYRMQLKSIIVDGNRQLVQKDIPFIIPASSEKVEIIPEIINYSIYTPYISLYIEGIDEKPTVCLQSELSTLLYNNLKAGIYKFHLGVLDNKGIHPTEETVYTIQKSLNIYDNWWFKVYTIVIIVMFIIWLTLHITSTLLRRRMEKQAFEMETIKNQVRMGNETIFAIANAVEARDKSTGRHSFRVAEYSTLIARELGFSDEQIESLRKTGLLHDIGKIGVPDSILNKPGILTPEEYDVMKTHVNIGGDILKEFTLIENVADGAKYHHERYDGKGYPNGLNGEEIPLNARIIGLADAFDAMTANRVYRKAKDMNYVISELQRCSGTQFDPGLVEIMLELIATGKIDVNETYKTSKKPASEDNIPTL
ncbi:MAG: HD domain-containing protein [Treponema sp.]|nr:HD domain-containing protein [Treponema sp.]